MKHQELLLDLGNKATFFGLGLLAAKKLRPYAKYFIIGGVAATAAPGIMAAVEQIKAKQAAKQANVEPATVEEVAVDATVEAAADCSCTEQDGCTCQESPTNSEGEQPGCCCCEEEPK